MVFFLTEAPLNTNIKVKQMVISQVRNDNQGGEHQKDVDMLLKLRMIMIIYVCVCVWSSSSGEKNPSMDET